jgi:hypothetical protein
MFKNLNQTAVAANGLPFIAKPRLSINERSKTITTTLLGIAGAVFVIGAGIAYLLLNQISVAQTRVINLQAQAGSSAQIAHRYHSTVDDYNTTTAQLAFLEPPSDQNKYVPTLLQQLQVLAQTTGLQVLSVQPGAIEAPAAKAASGTSSAAVPGTSSATPAASAAPAASTTSTKAAAAPSYQTLPVALQVSGTYRQIMKFVYALPKFPKILCLKRISLAPGGSQGAAPGKSTSSEPVLAASLSLEAYVFPVSASGGTATLAPNVLTASPDQDRTK